MCMLSGFPLEIAAREKLKDSQWRGFNLLNYFTAGYPKPFDEEEFKWMRDWGFNDSLKPLMLIPIFGAQGAFSAFMFRQFFITIPKELEEAARLDGLGTFGIFRRIMLPIAGPVISATAILAFLAAWNTYLEPLVFTSSIGNFTLPLSLNNFNDVYGQPQWNLQMAATTISILPIMLVYLFFQEKVTDAMVNSGLKG